MEFWKRIVLAFVVLLVVSAANPTLAQDARGRVQGVITDASGGVIPKVKVTLSNNATGLTATRETGDTGRFVFDRVDPGNFTLTAEANGFATVVQKNVVVHTRADLSVDLTLKVAGTTETLTVEASPVAVQFNDANSQLTVEQNLFKELPLASRNPATLALLDPSVNADLTRTASYDHYAANAYDVGGRTMGKNDILIDGSPVANSSKLGYNPSMDAVQEYTVRANAIDAEFGHSSGGIITMTLKSGTNDLHGSGYFFGGNPNWNAFTDRVKRSHSTGDFRNWGGSFGGPILKNKLFLFTSYDNQLSSGYSTMNYTLPTALERMGDFSQSYNANGSLRVIYDPMTSRMEGGKVVRDPFPGNKIPQDRWDPLAKKILDNLWMPNKTGDNLTGLNNYSASRDAMFHYYNLSNRVDYQPNDRFRTSGRVSFFRTNQDANDYTNGADPLKMRRTEGSLRNGLNISGDAIYTFNPTTVLTLRGSYYKTEDKRLYPEMGIGEQGWTDLWPNKWWESYATGRPIMYFPNIQVPSGDTFGVRNFWYQEPYGYSFGGLVNKSLTKHMLKFGSDWRYKRGWAARYGGLANLTFRANETQNTTSGAKSSTGNEWASFLLGTMNPGGSNTQYVPVQYSNTEMYSFYVQDDYKVNSRLTLSLGLRYEYEGGQWDPKNRLPQRLDLSDPIPGMQAALVPALNSQLVGSTGKSVTQLMAESVGKNVHLFNGAFYFTESDSKRATTSYKYEFMPRLGLAYALDRRTAIRFGWGRFYTPSSSVDNGNEPLGSQNLAAFSPITDVLPLVDGKPVAFLSNPFPQGVTEAYGKTRGRYTNLGDTISLAEYDRRPPISDRINLSLQREMWGTKVDAEWMVNLVSHDMLTVNLNMVDPRLGFTYKGDLDKAVPNPFYNYGTDDTFPGALRKNTTIAARNLLRPYPQYGDINQTYTDLGAYRQQSFKVTGQRPLRNGFTVLGSYAYNSAKAKGFYDDQDQYDRLLTWQTDTNPHHRIVMAGTYNLPFGRGRMFAHALPRVLDSLVGGWQLSGTYTYRSGSLLTFGSMVAPEKVKVTGKTGAGSYWLDKTGFDVLPGFTRRSNPRDYSNLFGPSFANLDATLSKRVQIREGMNMQFRMEAYNALNKLNWANPNLSASALNSDFGQVTSQHSASTGRRLQFMARFEF